MIRRRPRDERHHVCVERQTWHAMGAMLGGFALCGVLEWADASMPLVLLFLLVAWLVVPAAELLNDSHERGLLSGDDDGHSVEECGGCRDCRAAELVDDDAGRW